MDNEVKYNMESSSSHKSTQEPTAAPPPNRLVDPEKNITSKIQKLVTEEEALQYARAHSNDSLPLHICFGPDAKDNPRNFSLARKWYITIFASMLNLLISIAISQTSLAFKPISEVFHVSEEVATLAGLVMATLGAGVGVLFTGPLSERYGRKPVGDISQFFLFMFQIAPPLAPNITTIIVCRFLAIFLGTAPASNTGGIIHDLWVRDESGPALVPYIISSVSSPPFTLAITGYLVQDLGWRYVFWVMIAVQGAFWLLQVFTMPETRHSKILQKKASRVRKQLESEGLHNPISDEKAEDRKSLASLFKITLTRPIRFLFTEPIVWTAAFYNGYLFGIIYLFQGSFTLVFGPEGHGFNTGEEGLSFLGLLAGTLIGAALNPLQDQYYLHRIKEENKGVPEARMHLARWGTFLFPISLFWFAWTSYRSVHWIVPIIASSFFGIGFFTTLMALLSYVYDSYGSYCASALSALLFVRNMFGAFPLFGTQMYHKLGFDWATSLLGFLSLLLLPIPFVYFYKGETLRWRSPWAREHFDQMEDKP